MSSRLFVLGLDGAGHDLIARLCAEGVTPNIAALAQRGTLGPLRSTTPPITGPSWLGLASGLAPDQTGVPDFLVRRPPLLELRPISSRDFRGRSLWEPVGEAGARVAVFNFPILYPPYEINGVMVSGFGTDESTQWTFPESLKAELLAGVGADYNLAVNYHHEIYDDPHRFLDDLEASFDRRVLAAELLCRRERWDLFFFVTSETDWLLHRCWADLDPTHPRYDPSRSPAVAERARRFWNRVDAAIPRLMESFGDANLLVCSDHGFGPNLRTVKVNLLLERAGLLRRRAASERRGASLRKLGTEAARRAGEASARVGGPLGRALSRVRRRARRYLPRDESAYLASTVDLERTEVFDPGHTVPFAGLYVAPRIERGSGAYAETLARAEAALAEFGESEGVSFETRRSWRDAEGRVATLPDLLVSADDWACTFTKADFSGDPLVRASLSPRHTGSHRMHGLYLASGPAFHRSDGAEADILDIAPTVLALFGLAAPPDRRGRVLEDLFASRPDVRAVVRPGAADDDEASADEDADVRERLRGLGYIE